MGFNELLAQSLSAAQDEISQLKMALSDKEHEGIPSSSPSNQPSLAGLTPFRHRAPRCGHGGKTGGGQDKGQPLGMSLGATNLKT